MGTNFYTTDNLHVGKRSAAGLYCWDCKITLCSEGNKEIHSGRGTFLDKCPRCGKSKDDEKLENSTVGRELGFNNNASSKKTGVKTCSSFSWAIDPILDLKRKRKFVDEYGKIYTRKEFLGGVLSECPIQFYDSIGVEFS